MVMAPFFVMPTVSALIWKNMLMHPVSGLFAWLAKSVGLKPIDWFADAPLTADQSSSWPGNGCPSPPSSC